MPVLSPSKRWAATRIPSQLIHLPSPTPLIPSPSGLTREAVIEHVLHRNARPLFPPGAPAPYTAIAAACWAANPAERPTIDSIIEQLQQLAASMAAINPTAAANAAAAAAAAAAKAAAANAAVANRAAATAAAAAAAGQAQHA